MATAEQIAVLVKAGKEFPYARSYGALGKGVALLPSGG